jgi:multidrug resistance efflux pump
VIAEKTTDVEALIADITAKQAVADKQFEEANRTKKKLDEDSIIIKQKKEEADTELEAAQPAIEAAQKALLDVQAKDLNEVRALQSPPEAIRDVCTIAFHLKETSSQFQGQDEWSVVKNRLLNNTRLLAEL